MSSPGGEYTSARTPCGSCCGKIHDVALVHVCSAEPEHIGSGEDQDRDDLGCQNSRVAEVNYNYRSLHIELSTELVE
jgi:hypothetical protein